MSQGPEFAIEGLVLDIDGVLTDASLYYAPDGEFHFHRGPQFAAEALGYDAPELAGLPIESTRAVSNTPAVPVPLSSAAGQLLSVLS